MHACLPCVHTAYTSSVYHTCLCVPHAHTKAHVPECLGLLKLYVCARAHVHVYVVCHTYTHTHTLTFLTYRVECIEVHSSLAHYFDIIYRENWHGMEIYCNFEDRLSKITIGQLTCHYIFRRSISIRSHDSSWYMSLITLRTIFSKSKIREFRIIVLKEYV